jgi:DNA-directed RNA polymerase specialized sigma24 family protein
MFPTTRWTLILEAKGDAALKRKAFDELARVYWQPLFVFLRSKGLDAATAQDTVQELLLTLLNRDVVEKVTPERGHLRAYLKTAATNHLLHAHEKTSAQKRGAGAKAIPIDEKLTERLAVDTAHPDEAFEREWATLVMGRALEKLRQEHVSGARVGPFALVEQFFKPGAEATPSYADAAKANAMSLPQLKAFLHRARLRYRELVREEVLETVENPADVDAEMGALLEALTR